jgi:hypothetical protein
VTYTISSFAISDATTLSGLSSEIMAARSVSLVFTDLLESVHSPLRIGDGSLVSNPSLLTQ